MTDPQIPPEVEETVGAWVGIVAILHIQGVNEMITDGRIAAETKQQGAEVLTRLSMLRLDGYTIEDLEHAAFLYAPDAIRQCCNTLDTEQINDLINSVLGIVARSVKKEMH
jgi:hypothetical protein